MRARARKPSSAANFLGGLGGLDGHLAKSRRLLQQWTAERAAANPETWPAVGGSVWNARLVKNHHANQMYEICFHPS